MKKQKLQFKIGADPEFSISKGDKDISAFTFFNTLFGNKIDIVKMGHTVKNKGCIGWDGEISTGEIRPTQSNEISVVINNIEELFKEVTNKVKEIAMYTDSRNKPTGGHVHLELEKVNMGKKYHEMLYRKMAFYLQPLILAEKKENKEKRKKTKYGNINEYKVKRFKNKETMEIRTLSAEWLTTKKVAKSTLAYIAVCYNEVKQELCQV